MNLARLHVDAVYFARRPAARLRGWVAGSAPWRARLLGGLGDAVRVAAAVEVLALPAGVG